MEDAVEGLYTKYNLNETTIIVPWGEQVTFRLALRVLTFYFLGSCCKAVQKRPTCCSKSISTSKNSRYSCRRRLFHWRSTLLFELKATTVE